MDRISLTYFVDFVLATGTPKLRGVRDYKERKDDLCSDFYRPIRQAIISMHRDGLSTSTLDSVCHNETDETRRNHYPRVVAGYRAFLAEGPKNFFEPPRTGLSLGPLEVDVNPELGLVIGGKKHLVKLYFRNDPLMPRRTALVLALLSRGICEAHPEFVPAILDVRSAKLHTSAMTSPRIDLLLRGEAASFAAIYAAV
ncbi:MAG TPA: hypothetical protein PK156_23620 [Polyangium sp.]|nr:hypothetical protein [Polyangium sp.]